MWLKSVPGGNRGATTSSVRQQIRAVDNFAIKAIGWPWLELTRDAHIHERCVYLTDCLRRLKGTGVKILDVGCGSATALFYLNSYARGALSKYVGIDMLPPARLRVRYRNIPVCAEFHQVYLDQDWDFGTFDLVWCAEVIEHILDDRKLLRKLSSQVSPGGSLIITTPSRLFVENMARYVPGYETISKTQDGGHVRTGYDLDMLEELAHDCDLTLHSHAWLHPATAQDIRWHLTPHPTPIHAIARNVRDVFSRRGTPFVLGGDPKLYAERFISISVVLSHRNTVR